MTTADDEPEGDEYDAWLEAHPDEEPGPESLAKFLRELGWEGPGYSSVN